MQENIHPFRPRQQENLRRSKILSLNIFVFVFCLVKFKAGQNCAQVKKGDNSMGQK